MIENKQMPVIWCDLAEWSLNDNDRRMGNGTPRVVGRRNRAAPPGRQPRPPTWCRSRFWAARPPSNV